MRKAEHLFKPLADLLLNLIFRRGIFLFKTRGLRRRERLAVELAVCVEREFIYLDQKTRNHIAGEFFCKLFADFVLRDGPAAQVIAAQVGLAVIVLKAFDYSRFYPVDFPELNLDLAHLDALAVDLDHPVLPVDIQDVPVGQAFADVIRMEHAPVKPA